jgi:hypothetical protein
VNLKSLRQVSLVCILALFALLPGTLSAQSDIELNATATLSDDDWTVSINHPEDWVSVSTDEALFLADTQAALDVAMAGKGVIEPDSTGVIIFAPATATLLDLPDDAGSDDALTAFLEVLGLQSPSGEVYAGNPAISFNLYESQEDGTVDFGAQLFEGSTVDALAFEQQDTFIFVIVISNSDVFALTEAMWDSLTLTAADAAPADDAAASEGEFVYLVEDNGKEFAFSATLPAGWVSSVDDETGTIILASSEAALAVASGDGDELERGDTALVVTLPTGLRALEINPADSADLVFTAYAATLGIEAYPSFVEGFDVFTANGWLGGDNLPGGQALLYAFGFPAGVVTVMVQEVNGSSNPDTNAVIQSIRYDLPS